MYEVYDEAEEAREGSDSEDSGYVTDGVDYESRDWNVWDWGLRPPGDPNRELSDKEKEVVEETERRFVKKLNEHRKKVRQLR